MQGTMTRRNFIKELGILSIPLVIPKSTYSSTEKLQNLSKSDFQKIPNDFEISIHRCNNLSKIKQVSNISKQLNHKIYAECDLKWSSGIFYLHHGLSFGWDNLSGEKPITLKRAKEKGLITYLDDALKKFPNVSYMFHIKSGHPRTDYQAPLIEKLKDIDFCMFSNSFQKTRDMKKVFPDKDIGFSLTTNILKIIANKIREGIENYPTIKSTIKDFRKISGDFIVADYKNISDLRLAGKQVIVRGVEEKKELKDCISKRVRGVMIYTHPKTIENLFNK